ncbi:hypothetical protein [Meiothermus sp.]|uniref:hypothetical protein n=1 Tax=Meiothermus sp. TaxID=1955249 RepID=UPI00307D1F88
MKDVLTIALLGGLALGGYWLMKQSQPAPSATTQPQPEPQTGNSDVVNAPSPFGYSVGDPCKRFPWLCNF